MCGIEAEHGLKLGVADGHGEHREQNPLPRRGCDQCMPATSVNDALLETRATRPGYAGVTRTVDPQAHLTRRHHNNRQPSPTAEQQGSHRNAQKQQLSGNQEYPKGARVGRSSKKDHRHGGQCTDRRHSDGQVVPDGIGSRPELDPSVDLPPQVAGLPEPPVEHKPPHGVQHQTCTAE